MRERIVSAARVLFRERGYEGTVMSQLAKAAGVTTAALYWHFASKADLCAELLGRDYRDFDVALRERTVGDTAEQRLRTYTAAFVEMQLRDEDLAANFSYAQLRDMLPEEARQEIESLEREMFEMLKTILREGQESGALSLTEVTVTAYAIASMCEYVFVWFQRNGRLSAREVAALFADYAVRSVRPD